VSWQLGIASGACTDRPILDVLPNIKASGARGIEVGTPPRHFDPANRNAVESVAEALRAHDLRPVSIHAPFSKAADLASSEYHAREAALNAAVVSAEALARLGGRVVVVHPSDLERSGHDVEARLASCVRGLAVLSDCCRDLGLTLAVESPLPHLIGGHPDEFRWLLAELDASVRVCLDTGHITLGHHWRDFMNVADGRLVHVHASDNHGQRDDHLPPGDGRIDWADIRRSLVDVGYAGWIMLELSCVRDDAASYFTRALTQASALLAPA
jgi:sugar phosphate isomerase/epimerase